MELNEINQNSINTSGKNHPELLPEKNKNTISQIDNNNKNKFDSSKSDDGFNRPFIDKADISNYSAKKSKEQKYAFNADDSSEGSALITSDYMAQIVKKGNEIQKPKDVNMDDVSWGLLVQLGEKIGITSASRLAKLSVKDVEAFFYTKHIIEKGKQLSKEYMTVNDYAKNNENTMDIKAYWDNVFEAKAHNKQYSITVINQDNTGLSISAREFFSSHGNASITDLSAASLHNILMAEVNTDTAQFVYAVKNIAFTKKDQSLANMQKDMINSYNEMQKFSSSSITPYDQMQIIKKAVNDGNLINYKI